MKNMTRLAGIIAIAAVIGFGLAACGGNLLGDNTSGGNGSGNGLSEGLWNGVAKGARTTTDNSTLNSFATGMALDDINSPKFEINSDGTVMPMFGSGNYPFLAITVGSTIQYRFVQAADNSLTLQFDNNGWTDWNGSTRAEGSVNTISYKQTITGSFNPSDGKVTLELRYTAGSDYTARTYVFTKQ